jgi:hypothetical protein
VHPLDSEEIWDLQIQKSTFGLVERARQVYSTLLSEPARMV